MAPKRQSSSDVGAQAVLPFERCVAWYLENPYVPLDKDDRALLER